MSIRPFALIEAPSNLGLRPTGVETLCDALIAAGLPEKLNARRAGRVEAPAYDATRDPETLMLNPASIAAYSIALADAVGDSLDRGEFPIALGGDCSIMLGNLLALRRRGRYGLMFLDGHADFYQPEANENGEAADSDLALATGRGPEIMTNLEGRRPMVRDKDVAAIGMRDEEEAARFGSQPLPEAILALNLEDVRRSGAQAAANLALAKLDRAELQGFWIHLDADVLDDALMPAVDYRIPDGLHWEELETILRTAYGSGRAVGLEVTIFNPRLDPDGLLAGRLADALATGLSVQAG